MARSRRRVAAAAFGAVALAAVLAAPAPVLALRKLHVDALSMRADRTRLQVGEVFHLAIHARVREPIVALDELVVPDVGTMQLLGDERHVTSTPGGADVVETLTLEPTQSGTFTFAGAYVDAIDARTGKPSRFSSNSVRVVVEKPGVTFDGPWTASASFVATTVVGTIVVGGFIVLVIGGLLFALVRARPKPAPPNPVPQAPASAGPPRTARDEVAEALRAFGAAPEHASLMRLRTALFAAAGAGPGATLSDATAATQDERLRAALVAAEHAAFGPAATRERSAAELVEESERWLR